MDIYRRLAGTRPDAFLPDLAASLNNIGGDLSDLGRREEALAASQEAVDIRRRLAETQPDAFLPGLATSLNNTGAMLSNLGRREEALAASQEAVDIRRRLAGTRPGAFLPYLATSLNNLGEDLSNLGRREEALAASQEAVDIYRRLAGTRPGAFLPNLAMSLDTLGQTHLAAERNDAAAAAFEEGLTAIAAFVEQHPQAFGDLAKRLARGYIEACEKAGREPGAALLERIARALGASEDVADAPLPVADEVVREVFAAPQAQELLRGVMRQSGLDGEPASLPFEVQRAIVAALVGQGVIGIDAGKEGGAAPGADAEAAGPVADGPATEAADGGTLPRAGAAMELPAAPNARKRGWWPFRRKR